MYIDPAEVDENHEIFQYPRSDMNEIGLRVSFDFPISDIDIESCSMVSTEVELSFHMSTKGEGRNSPRWRKSRDENFNHGVVQRDDLLGRKGLSRWVLS